MRININDIARVIVALKAVNGSATAHVLDSAQLRRLTEKAEEKLSFLPKSHRKSAKLLCDSAEAVATAYKYTRVITSAQLERGGKDWFLTNLDKKTAWPDATPVFKILLSKEQRVHASEVLLSLHSII